MYIIKSRNRLFLVVSILLMAAPRVYAEEEKRNPVDEFRGTTQFHLLQCQIRAKTEFLKVESGASTEAYSEIGACLKKGRAEVKKLFPKANALVAKRPAASKLLKEYYAVWLSAFDGISPDINELKTTYDKRQGDASRKADEAWYRFEIEAGL